MNFSMVWPGILAAQQAFTVPMSDQLAGRADQLAVSDHVFKLAPLGARGDGQSVSSAHTSFNTESLLRTPSAYAVEVGIDGSMYDLLFDTGSANLVLLTSDIQCATRSHQRRPQSTCKFGPLVSGTFEQIPDQIYSAIFGDYRALLGKLGYADVTVAGVHISKQEVALVNDAFWPGDGVLSGIMGFGGRWGTTAFPGTAITAESIANRTHYDNFLERAIQQGSIDSFFTVVLKRGMYDSTLTLGGVAPEYAGLAYTAVPLEKSNVTDRGIVREEYGNYTIIPDGFELNGMALPTFIRAVVDTGPNFISAPSTIAREINSAFDPPSELNANGHHIVRCNATAPNVGVILGGTTFYIDPRDMLRNQSTLSKGYCMSTIQPRKRDELSLGGPFLRNVVAVFDVGSHEMKFAAQGHY